MEDIELQYFIDNQSLLFGQYPNYTTLLTPCVSCTLSNDLHGYILLLKNKNIYYFFAYSNSFY